MIDIPLAAVANQTLTIQLDDHFYAISLHAEPVSVSIDRDDVTVIQGARICPGTPLLPYRHEESGNFVLIVPDDGLPDFTQFGVTQFLVYLSQDEVNGLRA